MSVTVSVCDFQREREEQYHDEGLDRDEDLQERGRVLVPVLALRAGPRAEQRQAHWPKSAVQQMKREDVHLRRRGTGSRVHLCTYLCHSCRDSD
jgi:hypothetical protein